MIQNSMLTCEIAVSLQGDFFLELLQLGAGLI